MISLTIMKNNFFTKALFTLYLAVLLFILFARYGENFSPSLADLPSRFSTSVNLKPFHTIGSYLKALNNGNVSVSVVKSNLIGNFLLFMPYPLFISAFSKWKNTFWIITLTALSVVAVELTQILTGLGSLDVDDFILNVSGAFLAYVLLKPRRKKEEKDHK